MQICKTHDALAPFIQEAKSQGKRVGFVPTMGALHNGHLSLVKVAQEHADFVVVSIFVNPTQFAPDEDFDTYPRHIDDDTALLREAGVDAVYFPEVEEIYPDGPAVTVKAGKAAQGLESDFRPHFFDGVCSVVHRLFELVKPDAAVFGEKDYQQLMVIREMVEDHKMGIEIIGAPIVRDDIGLALSSRNAYLNKYEMLIADTLNVALKQNTDTALVKRVLEKAGFDKVDYVEQRWGRILAAAWIGKTRLIDNREV
jgi:pantoate--beta-alanine ligase